MARIFLSHSSGNNAEAIALRDWLIGHGWDDLFLDLDPERGLKAGGRWQEALKQAAERCELVIFLISPEWAASKWCLAEFLLAKNLNKRIFGVIVEPTPLTELPTEMIAEWQIVDLTAGTRDHKITATLPPGDRTAVVAFAENGLERLRIGLMQAGLDARFFAWPPENDPERAPYRGLESLGTEDAGIFFGRDGPIIVGLDLLRGLREAPPPRLLVILGASGAGKSSFLRAGLLPRLARENQQFLPLPVIRPERAALTGQAGLIVSLEMALRKAGLASTRAEIRKAVESGAASVVALLEALVNANMAPSAGDGTKMLRLPTLVLAIDQAEELFDTRRGAEEARGFLDLLRDLVTRDAPALIVLLAIRSDNYGLLQEARQLDGVRKVPFDVSPMPRGAYSEVIKGPARKLEGTSRALNIEESLVDALLADIEEGGAKDALPLLAFTLERLYYEHGGDGDLKLSDYEELGRIRGSIEAAVERALKAADTDPKIPPDREARITLLRRGLIPWLAGLDPETGSPRRRIARCSEIPPESRPLIDLLVEQRLLATDVSKETGEITIEPVHEALLRQWGLFQRWLREDTGLLAITEGVKLASRDWAANGKDVAWLTHVGDRLKAAKQLADRSDFAARIEPTDRDYLAACRKAERTTRGRKRRLQALVATFAFLLAVAGVAWLNEPNLKDQYHWLTKMDPTVLTEEQERTLKAKDEFKDCTNGCPVMVVVPAGKFMMGSPEGQGDEEERPQHEVIIATPFAIGKYEVTVAEWDLCIAAGGCPHRGPDKEGWGHPKWPAIRVTWENAQQYVTWLSRLSGKTYQLLTEAEWEYAARAGTTTSYSFGDGDAVLGEYAWYNANSKKQPHSVGEKKPNPFGLYDMHGNVWEWVQDLWHETYDGAPSDGLAWIEGGAEGRRILRGGSWYYNHTRLRSASRGWLSSDYRYNDLGFRVKRSLAP